MKDDHLSFVERQYNGEQKAKKRERKVTLTKVYIVIRSSPRNAKCNRGQTGKNRQNDHTLTSSHSYFPRVLLMGN